MRKEVPTDDVRDQLVAQGVAAPAPDVLDQIIAAIQRLQSYTDQELQKIADQFHSTLDLVRMVLEILKGTGMLGVFGA